VKVEMAMLGPHLRMEEGLLEWGEEAVSLASSCGLEVGLQERSALVQLLRDSLRARLASPPSPRMRGLMEELVDSNPLEALRAEDLPSRAYLRLLSHY